MGVLGTGLSEEAERGHCPTAGCLTAEGSLGARDRERAPTSPEEFQCIKQAGLSLPLVLKVCSLEQDV